MPLPRPRGLPVLVVLTAVAAGVLFAASARTAGGTDLRADRRLQLTELIASQRGQLAGQEQQVARLRQQVQVETSAASGGDSRIAAVQAAGAGAALAAGATPVTGPALTVSLADAPAGTPAPSPDDLVVHQQDVQAVVNALWAGGAEAMTLMGERVIATSAVRCVGNTLVLHGQVYGPPFVVTAVGDPTALRAALDTEPGVALFRRYVARFGLSYDVSTEDEARLPAYTGALELPSVTTAPR